VADTLGALVGQGPTTPMVYLLAAVELVWLLSAAAVVLSLVALLGHFGWRVGIALARRAARVGRRCVHAFRSGRPSIWPAAGATSALESPDPAS
jgi:hypothetical protein